eukprot:12981219-Alexandrium_andersonii.AAC.1
MVAQAALSENNPKPSARLQQGGTKKRECGRLARGELITCDVDMPAGALLSTASDDKTQEENATAGKDGAKQLAAEGEPMSLEETRLGLVSHPRHSYVEVGQVVTIRGKS